ncbi:carboxylating nicotinate-nucleotide diphosphorylase [bacterium]|nr:carboxylating nicotinate-nucleotide diphosphorylase [bacterium]
MNLIQADRILRAALSEDLGAGDVTTAMLPDPDTPVSGVFLCKGEGVLAGMKLALRCFSLLDPACTGEQLVAAGSAVHPGQELARVSGPASALLAAERVSLNILQRLSGIASAARRWSQLAAPLGIRIVETRKTTPGLRIFEKYAVAVGGAFQHRYGLDSAVMFKDNHFAISGLEPAALLRCARQRLGHSQRLIAEATDLHMALELALAGADFVLLDNFSPAQVREAVTALRGAAVYEARAALSIPAQEGLPPVPAGSIAPRVGIEISGGISEENLRDYLIEGVDVISSGALTHSVRALDISLEVTPQ